MSERAGQGHDDRRARRNALILACCQALYGIHALAVINLGGLAGHYLSVDKSLATLPVSLFVLGSMLTIIPAARLMRAVGRRVAFMIGAGLACFSACLAVAGLWANSFALFSFAMMFSGCYQAFAGYYRFTAADQASPAFKPKAVSWVLAGGVVAAVAGAQLVSATQDLFAPLMFAGTFAALGLVALLAIGATSLVDAPRDAAEQAASGRPILEIMRQPVFFVAAFSAMTAYALMNLMMTATPLAMVGCGFDVADTSFVIQWHVIAMFAPSFVTGNLIQRFGVIPVMGTGLALLLVCAGVALMGVEIAHFTVALALLGIGWNFAYVGGATLLTEAYRPEERAKTQAANDFLVFVTVVCASFLSGALLDAVGWEAIALAMPPMIVIAGGLLAWLAAQRRPAL